MEYNYVICCLHAVLSDVTIDYFCDVLISTGISSVTHSRMFGSLTRRRWFVDLSTTVEKTSSLSTYSKTTCCHRSGESADTDIAALESLIDDDEWA